MGRIIGIDLGTSTSEVAVLLHGRPQIIRDVAGARNGVLPSVVGIGPDGALLFGHDAERQAVDRAGFAVAEVKRDMGKAVKIPVAGMVHTPQEISALIIRHLADAAARFLGEPVTDAVITVPARFNELQRRATLDAGELAGLTVRRLINEPTAAAVAYGLDRPDVEERIVVYDLGGGTLDVTLLELSEGILDVLSSVGNDQLGGMDLDARIMSWISAEAQRLHGLDLEVTPGSRQRLKESARSAKEGLSSAPAVSIRLDRAGVGAGGEEVDLDLELTREAFEVLVADLVLATRPSLNEALGVRGLTPEQVDKVLLVGGSTRSPIVRRIVSEYFGGRVFESEVDPGEAVALGAAIVAGMVEHTVDPRAIVVTDVSSWTLGVEVNLLDGDERHRGAFDPLIWRNQTIPRTVTRTYAAMRDDQRIARVRVFQGEEQQADRNVFVGAVEHEDLTPREGGAEILVEFAYDLSGMLRVRVTDAASGRQVEAHMHPATERMTPEEKDAARARLDWRWRGSA